MHHGHSFGRSLGGKGGKFGTSAGIVPGAQEQLGMVHTGGEGKGGVLFHFGDLGVGAGGLGPVLRLGGGNGEFQRGGDFEFRRHVAKELFERSHPAGGILDGDDASKLALGFCELFFHIPLPSGDSEDDDYEAHHSGGDLRGVVLHEVPQRRRFWADLCGHLGAELGDVDAAHDRIGRCVLRSGERGRLLDGRTLRHDALLEGE